MESSMVTSMKTKNCTVQEATEKEVPEQLLDMYERVSKTPVDSLDFS